MASQANRRTLPKIPMDLPDLVSSARADQEVADLFLTDMGDMPVKLEDLRSRPFYDEGWPLFQIEDVVDPVPRPRVWVCGECLAARVDIPVRGDTHKIIVLRVKQATIEECCEDCRDHALDAAADAEELRKLPR